MRHNPEQSFFAGFFHSKLLAVCLLVVALAVLAATLKEKKQKDLGDTAIKTLESEIADLEGKNNDLNNLFAYLNSQEFIELEAREKLGMKKPGEKVVIIPRESKALVAGESTILSVAIPNYLKWYYYFFE